MNFHQLERAVAFGLSALVLLLIAFYIGLVLHRLRPAVAACATLAGVAGLWVAAWLATDMVSLGLMVSGWVLASAHCGWAWGRRGVRRSASRQSNTEKTEKSSAPQKTKKRPVPAQSLNESTPWGAAVVADKAPDQPRLTLGHYKIEREIGRGSMGAVYLGIDQIKGHAVAIKTMALSQEFEGEALTQARARFFREAETAGRLQHPDIVQIFDAGEEQDLAYIAMEYLAGQDLHAFVQPGRLLPVFKVLDLVARVADALAYAHSQGVVHRDVKPANVMVDLHSNVVKVMDFGIAHVSDALRTRTGMVLGTPSFMSPEQMAGSRLDGRSDIYSLGVMLFQLLTGRLPHQAESMARVMYLIANEPAPDIRSVREDLPEALANVVALALEKRPETRYADAHQLAADLREVGAFMLPSTEGWELLDLTGDKGAQSLEGASAAVPPRPAVKEFAATVTFMRSDSGHNRPE